jgi:hypothetical protein
MPKSAGLRLSDLRAIHELIGECRDLGDDAGLWHSHFAGRLGTLIDADMMGGGEVTDLFSGGPPRILGLAEWGYDHGFDLKGWRESCRLFESHPDLAFNPTFRNYVEGCKPGRMASARPARTSPKTAVGTAPGRSSTSSGSSARTTACGASAVWRTTPTTTSG